jgi:hypothetical protein
MTARRRITILLPADDPKPGTNEGMFDVIENGRCCNGLAFDEMIGQVVALAMPEKRRQYPMLTKAEWRARERESIARRNRILRGEAP